MTPHPTMADSALTNHSLAALSRRLETLEVQAAAHRTLARYLQLCDVPQPELDWTELASLFTEDAVWEGIGPAYAGKFGRCEGRTTILTMLAGFLPPAEHFVSNVHLLGGGRFERGGDGAVQGSWIMQQLSAYDDGTAELTAARLTVEFDGRTAAAIRHFRTEKLFTTKLDPAAAMTLSATDHK